jgi:hypothetical protein
MALLATAPDSSKGRRRGGGWTAARAIRRCGESISSSGGNGSSPGRPSTATAIGAGENVGGMPVWWWRSPAVGSWGSGELGRTSWRRLLGRRWTARGEVLAAEEGSRRHLSGFERRLGPSAMAWSGKRRENGGISNTGVPATAATAARSRRRLRGVEEARLAWRTRPSEMDRAAQRAAKGKFSLASRPCGWIRAQELTWPARRR